MKKTVRCTWARCRRPFEVSYEQGAEIGPAFCSKKCLMKWLKKCKPKVT